MKIVRGSFVIKDFNFYEPKALLCLLIIIIVNIFLLGSWHIDDIFSMLFLLILGIIVALPGRKWTIQSIEICLKEGKPLSAENVRAAAKHGKKSVNYFFIILGLGLIIFALGLLFPELYLGDIAVPDTPFMRAFGAFIFYFMGISIGLFIPIYLRVRKLPK